MNFGNFGSLAKDAMNKFDSDENQNKDAQQPKPENTNESWTDIGQDAKKAFTDYQQTSGKGEAPNYSELGNLAKKAATTYNSSDNKDPTAIGKSIVSGMFGGGSKAAEPEQKPTEDKQDAQ